MTSKAVFVMFAAGNGEVEALWRVVAEIFGRELQAAASGVLGQVIVPIPEEQWRWTDGDALRETLRYAGFSGEFEVLGEVSRHMQT